MNVTDILESAKKVKDLNAKFLQKIESDESLDAMFHVEHGKVFEKLDCLDCANCCKTTSPIILQEDMDRIATHLNITTGEFIQKYLEMDEDGDFVFQSAPCPMLLENNKCSIYEIRPAACREYPHTNRKNMSEILDLTLENTLVCPAVVKIVDGLNTR
ncbi:MAG: YkgJ family cysteine cluster protein [Salibacteraceae bacterium]